MEIYLLFLVVNYLYIDYLIHLEYIHIAIDSNKFQDQVLSIENNQQNYNPYLISLENPSLIALLFFLQMTFSFFIFIISKIDYLINLILNNLFFKYFLKIIFFYFLL